MENSRVMRSMLFDFYGELLTDKQREYFDLHYNEDLSLAEIAEQSGISRQGVWDIIRRAEAAMTAMQSSELNIAEYSDTYVKGYVTAADSQTLFTTIPYDTGWTVCVDGEKVEYESFEDSFILVKLEAGDHTVEFRYEPRGVKIGAVISAAALAAFVLLQILEAKRKNRAIL